MKYNHPELARREAEFAEYVKRHIAQWSTEAITITMRQWWRFQWWRTGWFHRPRLAEYDGVRPGLAFRHNGVTWTVHSITTHYDKHLIVLTGDETPLGERRYRELPTCPTHQSRGDARLLASLRRAVRKSMNLGRIN